MMAPMDEPLHENLRAARTAARMSHVQVVVELRRRLHPLYDIDASTLSRWERGVTKSFDPVVLTALADIYGTTVEKLSPAHADAARNARDLLVNTLRWIAGCERTAA
jgi:transcriptional regulator with XRE-family HTH domain